MAPDLLEIYPADLRFNFELKKQSSCTVHLSNKSSYYVAFKVKTTSPKRYCVRPNTGIILPRSSCDFTVTMQGHRIAPPHMQLKDKFLVQSTVVPHGTTDEDILPTHFSKETGRCIEESKLRVLLVSPPYSPELQPISVALKQETSVESPVLKEEIILGNDVRKSTVSEAHSAKSTVSEAHSAKESIFTDDQPTNIVGRPRTVHVARDYEDSKFNLHDLQMRLDEAEKTIIKMREENSLVTQERDELQQETVLLRKPSQKVHVGFPLLFVVYVALICVVLGYWLHN